MKLKGSYFYTLRENSKDEDSVSGNFYTLRFPNFEIKIKFPSWLKSDGRKSLDLPSKLEWKDIARL